MNKPKIAINGFGRIGRQIFRINHELGSPLDIVAVNNIGDNKTTAHLLQYDSSYGKLKANIECPNPDTILIDNQPLTYLQIKNPAELPWKQLGIDIVIESTGLFTDRENASKHLQAGAKKVIISAPAKQPDITLIMGVNQNLYNPAQHNIISNASCTTNCMAPIVKILNDQIGIKHGTMTTIHSYTNDQRLQDLEHKDLRRARAAALSMIPTTTGAATSVTEVIPELKDKLDGFSVRVPTPVVSLLDFVFVANRPTTTEQINQIFQTAATTNYKNIIEYTELPLVSVDFKQNPHSAIIDGLSTHVIDQTLVKVIAWYDNEWGYSTRTLELTQLIANQL